MLGSFRFLLAVLVAIAHLARGVDFVGRFGVYAVFGFYVISGYLMTLILNEAYGFRLKEFAFNRFLRLYPAYYVVALVTLPAIAWLPDAPQFLQAWRINRDPLDLASNVLLFPFAFYAEKFRLIPPGWSLAVEIVNYFLLWAFVARGPQRAAVAFAAALAFHLTSLALGQSWPERYEPFYAALLPFSMGSGMYFIKRRIDRPAPGIGMLAAGFGLWLVNLFLAGAALTMGDSGETALFYLNLILVTGLVFMLVAQPRSTTWRLDKLLGDLAYPLFLTHWLASFIVARLVLPGEPDGLAYVAISLLLATGVSIPLAWGGNLLLDPVRLRVRRRATAAASARGAV
jgi:peptidoglycan/LPS O-acetylase OafA/YrhL